MPSYSLTPDLFKALQELLAAAAAHDKTTIPKYLAFRCGLSESTRKRWNRIVEAGEACVVDSDNLEKIAVALGYDAESLLYKLRQMRGHASVPSLPREDKLEIKAMVRPGDAGLSEWLLDTSRRPPSLGEVIQRVECRSVDDKEKDVGRIGDPPYNHIVQIGVAVTLHRSATASILYTHRRELAHPGNSIRTLGGSVLFSKAVIKNHKNADATIDQWIETLSRDPSAASRSMLELRGAQLPIPLYLLRSRITVPSLVGIESVRPSWVITNDQRGVTRHDGRVMRTVYTCYAFHVALRIPDGVDYGADDFASPDDKRVMRDSLLRVNEHEVRRIVSSTKDGSVTVNGMDYVVFRTLQGNPCMGAFNGGNGVVGVFHGFDIA